MRLSTALAMSRVAALDQLAYSSCSGRRQTSSPARSPAARDLGGPARRRCPSGPRRWSRARSRSPPVSVARSTSRSAPSSIACARQSASTSRPSASVLLISIVVPVLRAHDVAGLHRAAATAGSRSRRSRATSAHRQLAARAIAADRARAPPRRRTCRTSSRASSPAGLDRDPAGVERHRLADEAEQRAGDVGAARSAA